MSDEEIRDKQDEQYGMPNEPEGDAQDKPPRKTLTPSEEPENTRGLRNGSWDYEQRGRPEAGPLEKGMFNTEP